MDEARALVHALCSSSVSCVPWPQLHAPMLINDLFLISLHLLCTGMDEARVLVRALCNSSVSPMSSPLLHASMLKMICSWFHYTCCARARTRHTSWYVPCAIAACLLCRRLCCMRDSWKWYVLDFITPVVHGHGRGMRFGTCLVQLQCVSCVVASAACMTAKTWSVFDFITPIVHGNGQGTRLGTCLVQLQCVSYVAASAACMTTDK